MLHTHMALLFYTLQNLQDSQTLQVTRAFICSFYTLQNLQDSQTLISLSSPKRLFYTLQNLQDSQTKPRTDMAWS